MVEGIYVLDVNLYGILIIHDKGRGRVASLSAKGFIANIQGTARGKRPVARHSPGAPPTGGGGSLKVTIGVNNYGVIEVGEHRF